MAIKAQPLSSPKMNKNEKKARLQSLGAQYIGANKVISQSTEEKERIKKEAIPLVREMGVEDDNGHIVHNTDDGIHFRLEKRAKPQFDADEAEKILRKKKLWEEVAVEVIDQDRLQELIAAGEITDAEVLRMFIEPTGDEIEKSRAFFCTVDKNKKGD